MPSRRVQKVAEAIREVVSMAILTDLKDPRVRDVTVTYVEVSGDLRHAKIHVSVMGDDSRQNLTLRGLQSAAGYLQSKVARELNLRYTPKLNFLLDQGVKRSIEISRILREVLPPEEVQEEESEPAGADDPVDTEPSQAESAPPRSDAGPPPATDA